MRVIPPGGYRKSEDPSPLRFASAPMSSWLREWIDAKVQFALLECGHYVDRNARGPIVCGDSADCGLCEKFCKIIRPATLLERFGLTMTQHTEPPF